MIPDFDLVVAGGGPAGLACAISAARAFRRSTGTGARILILEKMPRPGRKLLVSGQGKCNITHSGDSAAFLAHYNGGTSVDPAERPFPVQRFLKPALLNFTNTDLANFLSSGGVELADSGSGKLFPASGRALDVLVCLERFLAAENIPAVCGLGLKTVEVLPAGGFRLYCSGSACVVRSAGSTLDLSGWNVEGSNPINTRTLCISTGGASWPVTGSSGDGYALASGLGHTIIPAMPALSPVRCTSPLIPNLAGVALRDCCLRLWRKDKKVAQGRGDVLFTHTGLSGPGILDISRHVRSLDVLEFPLLPIGIRESLNMPDFDGVAADRILAAECDKYPKRESLTVLLGLGCTASVARELLDSLSIRRSTKACTLSRQERKALSSALCGHKIQVQKVEGFETAMLTAGGIALAEVDPATMASRIQPGLWFAGEVLDYDGDTGGYNLQAAFSTGVLAGKSIARELGTSMDSGPSQTVSGSRQSLAREGEP